MRMEARPGRRGKRTEAPTPKESEIPKDALLTRGFVKRLPGYVEGKRIEHDYFSGKPNWSGEVKHEGRSSTIEVRESSDNALDIIITTSGRRDFYHSEVMHNYNARRSYVSYKFNRSEVSRFPLVPVPADEPFSHSSRMVEIYIKQDLYFLDNDRHNGSDSNGQIFREGEVESAPMPEVNAYPLSDRIGKHNPVFKSFEVLKELMLKAKPTTP